MSSLGQFTPAQTLDTVYLTLSPEPLTTQAELDAFYREEMNQARGEDKVRRLKLGLKRAANNNRDYFKACLMGHPGVGKSTEITRLIHDAEFKQQYRSLQFNVLTDLNPINFNPLDIILLVVVELAEETHKIIKKNSGLVNYQSQALNEFLSWYNTTERKVTSQQESDISTEAGGGLTGESLWAAALGLFASIKSRMRFAANREQTVTEYRFQRLNDLITIANQVIEECHQQLRNYNNQQWLIVGENFDKPGVNKDSLRSLFIDYANVIHDLNINLIFTIPIGLYNSSEAIRLAFPREKCHIIPDTAVFNRDFSSNTEGRKALRAVLNSRINLALFEPPVLERLIIASGGNIRDLFSMVADASDEAILSEKKNVTATESNFAINHLTNEYERRLGQNPFDLAQISYSDKVERLKLIYSGDKAAQIPDEALYALLNDRAVQEVSQGNGECRFVVHPLVVDLLHAQGHINASETGEVLGGTNI